MGVPTAKLIANADTRLPAVAMEIDRPLAMSGNIPTMTNSLVPRTKVNKDRDKTKVQSLRLSELVFMFKHFFLFHSLVVRHQSSITLQDFPQKKNPFLPSRKKKANQRQKTVASTPAWSETTGPFSPSKTTACRET